MPVIHLPRGWPGLAADVLAGDSSAIERAKSLPDKQRSGLRYIVKMEKQKRKALQNTTNRRKR